MATHSSVCGEFASYVFVICALEHRDGGGTRTCVNLPDKETQPVSKKCKRRDKSSQTNYMRVDYVFPRDNADDTRPGNKVGDVMCQ
mgnify:CR=1 FL=1